MRPQHGLDKAARAQTAEDARTTLRTTSHAARFDDFRDADELVSAVNKVAPYQKPAILPQDLSGVAAKPPKLVS